MTIHGYFTFDGVDIRSFGDVDVVMGGPGATPSREFNVIQAAGRNGDIVLDNEKYANATISYWVMVRDNFESVYQSIRGFLLSRTGYCRLSDSWHPGEFYQAYVSMPLEPTVARNRDLGAFEVTFSRKPQRFLVSGETDIASQFTTYNTYYSIGNIENPTYFSARPRFSLKIRISGVSGTHASLYLAAFYISTKPIQQAQPNDPENLRKIVLWDGTYNYTDPGALQGVVVSDNDIIDIDCEARTVFNRTTGASLDEYAYILDGSWNTPQVYRTSRYFNDFPMILPTIGTDYKCSPVYVRAHEVLSFYPRWWTI